MNTKSLCFTARLLHAEPGLTLAIEGTTFYTLGFKIGQILNPFKTPTCERLSPASEASVRSWLCEFSHHSLSRHNPWQMCRGEERPSRRRSLTHADGFLPVSFSYKLKWGRAEYRLLKSKSEPARLLSTFQLGERKRWKKNFKKNEWSFFILRMKKKIEFDFNTCLIV